MVQRPFLNALYIGLLMEENEFASDYGIAEFPLPEAEDFAPYDLSHTGEIATFPVRALIQRTFMAE
jgi:hypothetical protein